MQALLRHQVPDGDLATIVGWALESLGVSGSVATGVAVGLLMVFALKLTPLRRADPGSLGQHGDG